MPKRGSPPSREAVEDYLRRNVRDYVTCPFGNCKIRKSVCLARQRSGQDDASNDAKRLCWSAPNLPYCVSGKCVAGLRLRIRDIHEKLR